MLDWPCHSRGQIKRSFFGGEAGEFVQDDLAAGLLVQNAAHCLLFGRDDRELLKELDSCWVLKWHFF